MVVYRYRQNLLGPLLPDHVLIEDGADLFRRRKFVPTTFRLRFLHLLADDVIAQVDTLVADKDRGAGNQLAHFVLALAAEGAIQQLAVVLAVAGISHSIDPMGSFKHKMKAIVGIFKPTRRPNVSTASIAEP